WWHITARGNVPTDATAKGVPLIAAAAELFDFDAGRVPAFERPENPIEYMTAHVADRAVAEVVPAMPFVRMDVIVKVAIRRRTDPFIPVQSSGYGFRRRAWTFASIRPVSPAMRLGHLADHAGPNVFAQLAITFLAMALVAHLRRDPGFRGHLAERTRL